MNILLVLYHGMSCNSALHVAALSRALHDRGDRCRVAVPDALLPAARETPGRDTPADVAGTAADPEVVGFGAVLAERCSPAPAARPDVLVAWTPRENVRRVVERLRRRWQRPVVVHLEDNEDAITARYLGLSTATLHRRARWPIRALRGLALAHPHRLRRLLARADGVSLVMDRLAEFVPAGVPSQVLWPGYDESLFGASAPPPPDTTGLLRSARIPDGATVLAYTGNIHRGNSDDMADLYRCVAQLNARGLPTRLLRTGETHDLSFAARVTHAAPCVTELGLVDRRHLPGVLARADILVQPGAPGPFNDYRFPSKLPEFLASGKPLVMARTNLGRFLAPGREALVVPGGRVDELCAAVRQLVADRELAARIGRGGRSFAEHRLRWDLAATAFRDLLTEARRRQGAPR